KPLSNTRLYVMDDRLREQPIGVAGELCIAGAGLARGYLNRPELTEEKFVQHPNGERLYRTGDLARWLPDGNLDYLGRIDEQVKIRGYRIELGEIEAVLQRHEQVKEAVVIARQDKGADSYLCAYVVGHGKLEAAELRRYVGSQLPSYMVPAFFVELTEVPLTPNGKVDRRGLPEPERSAMGGESYVAPRTELEAKLAEIWQSVLGIAQVGAKDNFFELGGHSLKATMLVAQLHKELNVSIHLRDIFQTSSLAELAERISKMEKEEFNSIVKTETRAYYPVSSAQKRMYALSQLEGVEASYNIPVTYLIEGKLDTERVEEVFRTLLERHESLRTSFGIVEEEVVQFVHEGVPLVIEYDSFADESKIHDHILKFVRPFDLSQHTLLRIGLTEIGTDRHILLLDMHHIISDGTSLSILVEEFIRLYQGETLTELRLQYKDYAVWERDIAQSKAYNKIKAYWLERFSGEVPVLNLHTDYPRPSIQSFEGAAVNFRIEQETAAGLRKLIASTGATMYMILLAAYTALLSKYTGQEDIIVGTPVAGRSHADLEKIIGMFVGTVALRNYPLPNKPFSDFVLEVKENALLAFENQSYPLEELAANLSLPRDPSRNPIFSTMFALQNIPDNESSKKEHLSLSFTPLGDDHYVSKVDLTLYAMENEALGTLDMNLEYCTKLFKRESIDIMAGHFIKLLEHIVHQPEAMIADIPLSMPHQKQEARLELAEIDF
ncbi:AMP-binding protein, partial [Paenibacillus oenotherae]